MLDVESLREFEAFLAGREERGWIRKQCPQAGFHAFCVIGVVEGAVAVDQIHETTGATDNEGKSAG